MFSGVSRAIPSFGDLSWKSPVLAALTPNDTLLPACVGSPVNGISIGQTITANANGDFNATAAIVATGVTFVVGDRLLVAQTVGLGLSIDLNGIYTVTSLGSAGSKWKLTRAKDADTVAELPGGSICWVMNATLTGHYLGAFIRNTLGAWLEVPQELDYINVLGLVAPSVFGGGLIINGAAGLAIGQVVRPASAVYSFQGALNVATGTITLNMGNLAGCVARMPKAGYIVGVDINPSTNRTAGTANAHATVNGVQKNVLAPGAGAGNPGGIGNVSTIAAADTFAAGDLLRANVVTAGYAPTTGNVNVDIFVIFDAIG